MTTWILLGMMGVGKSTLGRSLAAMSGRKFLDTDSLIEKKAGHSVSRIFKIYSEEAFRDFETGILRSLEPSDTVLATGGGIVLREANWQEFRRLGKTIYLDATLETLVEHLEVSRKKRPLLSHDDWQERLETILKQRRSLYEQADHIVSVSGLTPEEAAKEVYRVLTS